MTDLKADLKHIIKDTAWLQEVKAFNERQRRWDAIGRRVNYLVQLPVTVEPDPVEVPDMYWYDIEALKVRYGIDFDNFVYVDHHIEMLNLRLDSFRGGEGGVVVSKFHYTKYPKLWK